MKAKEKLDAATVLKKAVYLQSSKGRLLLQVQSGPWGGQQQTKYYGPGEFISSLAYLCFFT